MIKETPEFTAHGYLTITNTGGIEVEINKSCDGVRYRFNYSEDPSTKEIYEAEIEYIATSEDPCGDVEAGFFHGTGEDKIFYPLSEFMRIQ